MDERSRRTGSGAQNGQGESSRFVNVSDRHRRRSQRDPQESTSISSADSGASGSRFSYYAESSPLTAPSLSGSSFPFGSAFAPESSARGGQAGVGSYEQGSMFGESLQAQGGPYQGENYARQYVQAPYPQPRYTGNLGDLGDAAMGDVPQSYVPREFPSSGMEAASAGLDTQGTPQDFAHPSFASQSSANRSQLARPYYPGMNVLQQQPETGTGPGEGGGPDLLEELGQATSIQEAYSAYRQELARLFHYIRDGRLTEAGPLLLQITNWFLAHVTELGLHKDDSNQYDQRITLWNEFNTCWLSILQKQKDGTLVMLRAGRPLPAPATILPQSFLERMARDLIRCCDNLERYGLVDYEMGVWEEEIIHLLEQCLDLIEGDNESIFQELSSQSISASGIVMPSGSGAR